MNFAGKKVIFLGDSITEGACADSPEKIYHAILKDRLNLREAVNRGIGGTRIARQTEPPEDSRYDEDFNMRYDVMEKDADILLIFGGTNDYGHGDAEIGADSDRSLYTFCGAFRTLLEKAVADFGRDNVIVLTPMHRKGEENLRGEGRKKRDGAPLCVYVKTIKRLATEYGVRIINLYDEPGLDPNIRENAGLFAPDGLHPSNDGHRLLAAVIEKNLTEIP